MLTHSGSDPGFLCTVGSQFFQSTAHLDKGRSTSLVSRIEGSIECFLLQREPNSIFRSYLKVLHMETSISFGSLQKFEPDA